MNTVTNTLALASSSEPTTTTSDVAHVFHGAYFATAADRAALPASDLLPVNLDVQGVITTVLAALSRMATLRPEIVAHLPKLDIAQFDKIEAYAKALAYAQTTYLATSTAADELPALAARAMELRELLGSDATALAKRNLLDGKRLEDLKGGQGYLNVAYDLGVLVRMLRERWTEIATKSAIQQSEVDEAEQAFERITVAYAERARSSDATDASAEDRQRAFTLLVRAYDQARRAATYLRWDAGDADKIVPSLWAGRGGRGNGASAANAKTGETGATTEPAIPAATTPTAPGSVPPPNATNDAAPGFPGGSPFAHA